MSVLTQTPRRGASILSIGAGEISFETVTVASGEVLKAGAVVGKITASGNYAAYDNAASDGTEVAAGVLFDAVDATDGAQKAVIVARLAEVAVDQLVYAEDQDSTAKTAAVADLKALNIIAR